MTKAQFRVLMLLTVISGLVGGGLADLLFRGLAARAAQTTAAPKVIEAQEFRLVDSTGKQRAVLGLSHTGALGLWLYDAAGKGRASLGLLGDGKPFLSLRDAANKRRVYLSLLDWGEPFLSLRDDTGQNRAVVGCMEGVTKKHPVSTYPESTLTLFNENGDVLWQAP